MATNGDGPFWFTRRIFLPIIEEYCMDIIGTKGDGPFWHEEARVISRKVRQISKTGIYHIMLRGNEQRDIFLDGPDRLYFLKLMDKFGKEEDYNLYAYCLMDNHVHLLLQIEMNRISLMMKRLNTSYAMYFNQKYKRSGHLFQDRFRSEAIEDDRYFLAAIRYIHNNPVMAGMVKKPLEYLWSSYRIYLYAGKMGVPRIDREFLLKMFASDEKKAIELFAQFSELEEENLSINKVVGIFDKDDQLKQAALYVSNYFIKKRVLSFQELINNEDQKDIVAILRNKYAMSERQTAKLLGISRSVVQRNQ